MKIKLSKKYIPWRKVYSWRCFACGKCCMEYRVRITLGDYIKIKRFFGDAPIKVDRLGRFIIRKLQNGRCVFQDHTGRCTIQELNIKPSVCKIYPFAVFEGEYFEGDPSALLIYKGKEFYVYVDSSCSGFNAGNPMEFPLAVKEAVDIYLDHDSPQFYTTCTSSKKQVSLMRDPFRRV
ncbi:MAG: YkgJ family cysteine cluster protein [Candidatus Odinarchaeia archaeon]